MSDANAESDAESKKQSGAPNGAEKRSSPRQGFKTEVSFQVSERPDKPKSVAPSKSGAHEVEAGVGFNSDTNFFAGFTEDIGDGGLFVATVDILPLGTKISLNFSLPDGQTIKTKGIVRWVRDPGFGGGGDAKPGMGIQFEDIPDEIKKSIHAFMNAREPMFYDDE